MINHRATRRRCERSGTIAVLTAVMLVMLLGMVAFAVDVGYLLLARTELQRSADSAALAAAWELIDENELVRPSDSGALALNAKNVATQYGGLNSVLRRSPMVPASSVTVGYLSSFSDPTLEIDPSYAFPPNAVRVRVSRTGTINGEVPFFLAKILGLDSAAAEAESTAAIVTSIRGFRTPSEGGNLGILPFALDLDTWNDMLKGIGTDDWTWNADTGEVEAGPDGILEMNLFPQGTGSPGNRGTVDIGSSDNSTADFARQILDGVTSTDLAHHGGSLELSERGTLSLNGDTGISAGVKDELLAIRGEPRVIPLFTEVVNPGNNAEYTLVKFVGVRILAVKLSGSASTKHVTIQPAQVVAEGTIPGGFGDTSHFIYSPTWIIR